MFPELTKLAIELEKIDDFMLRAEDDFKYLLEKVHPSHQKNAVNSARVQPAQS